MINLTTIPPEVWQQGFGPVRVSPLTDALRAYRADDERHLWEFAERRIGHKVNAVSKVGLRDEFCKAEQRDGKDAMQVPLLVVYREIDGFRGRMRRLDAEEVAKDFDDWTWEVRQGMRRPYVESALKVLEGLEGQTDSKVLESALWKRLPAIAVIEDAGAVLTPRQVGRKVTNEIRREAFESTGDPRRTIASDSPRRGLDEHGDDAELVAFMHRELLTQAVRDAGLTQQEIESWAMSIILESNEEAATLLARSSSQVAQEKRRAKEKLQANRKLQARRAV